MTTSITPQELGQLLDVASRAPTTLAHGHALAQVITKLIGLANQKHPIGAVVPFSEKEVPHCATCGCGLVKEEEEVKSVPTGTDTEGL